MQNHNKTIKNIIGAFLGVASVSALINLPGLVQAKLNSSQSIAQMSPNGGTMSAPGSTNSNPGANTTLDREFITKAAQSDMTEIQTSQLALQKSQTKAVRDFAQEMIREHTNSSKELKPIAMSKNVTLPKDIGPENKALLASLRKVNGKNFDRAYMQGQVQAHTKTLAEYQKYLEQGQDQQLKPFAAKISPIVAHHLQMAQSMIAKR